MVILQAYDGQPTLINTGANIVITHYISGGTFSVGLTILQRKTFEFVHCMQGLLVTYCHYSKLPVKKQRKNANGVNHCNNHACYESDI